MTGEKCPRCGTATVNTGSPIWEDYCPNEDCTYDREQFGITVRSFEKTRNQQETAKVAVNYWPLSSVDRATAF